MKILHIINEGLSPLPERIIDVQSRDNEVRVVELSKKDISYESVINDIFSHDRVISW